MSAIDLFVGAGCLRHIAEHYVAEIAKDVQRHGVEAARMTWRTTADPGEDDWLAAIEAALAEATDRS